MPIQFDNYNAEKIERLKLHLSHYADKGQAKPYEIYVDNLKAVPKTEATEDFYSYETYLSADTEKIKIIIYNSLNSPRNEQFVFLLKASNREQARELGLSGLDQDRFTRRSVSLWQQQRQVQDRRQEEIQALRYEISRLRAKEKEQLELIDTYEKIIEKAKANGNKIGGIHAGEIVSVALEGLVRRNTHLLAKLPFGAELAGIIEADTKRQQETSHHQSGNGEHPQSQSQFTRLETQSQSDAQSAFVELFTALEQHLTKAQLEQVSQLLGMVLDHPALLEDLLDQAREWVASATQQDSQDLSRKGNHPGRPFTTGHNEGLDEDPDEEEDPEEDDEDLIV